MITEQQLMRFGEVFFFFFKLISSLLRNLNCRQLSLSSCSESASLIGAAELATSGWTERHYQRHIPSACAGTSFRGCAGDGSKMRFCLLLLLLLFLILVVSGQFAACQQLNELKPTFWSMRFELMSVVSVFSLFLCELGAVPWTEVSEVNTSIHKRHNDLKIKVFSFTKGNKLVSLLWLNFNNFAKPSFFFPFSTGFKNSQPQLWQQGWDLIKF